MSPVGRVLRWRPTARATRLLAQGLVLVVVAAGAGAVSGMHRVVTVDVDGVVVRDSGFGGTVADALARHGVTVGQRDLVVPAVGSPLVDGDEIVVRTAHRMTVEVDGEQRSLWTTASTVGEAIEDLGVREGALVSASRSTAVGRTAVDRDDAVLRVSTPKTLHVAVDGQVVPVRTTALTLRDALREIGLVLGEGDRLTVPLDATVVEGLAVVVTRVASGGGTETLTQPFETRVEDDPRLPVGTEVVVQQGRLGTTVLTYASDVVGGQEVGRRVVAEVAVATPQDRIVRKGTMRLSAAAVEPGTARAIGKELAAARGWGDDQFACLDKLWTKESGWRVDATNRSSGAYGIPQAYPGTKLATAGADWQTNPATQITWGLGYIAGRYGNPCEAWSHSVLKNWY